MNAENWERSRYSMNEELNRPAYSSSRRNRVDSDTHTGSLDNPKDIRRSISANDSSFRVASLYPALPQHECSCMAMALRTPTAKSTSRASWLRKKRGAGGVAELELVVAWPALFIQVVHLEQHFAQILPMPLDALGDIVAGDEVAAIGEQVTNDRSCQF